MTAHIDRPVPSTFHGKTKTLAGERAGATKSRVLCIDNRASRNLAVFLLRRAGYKVTTADSIFEAIDLSRDKTFDIFLLNHKLPLGADLYEELSDTSPGTPILLYSTVIYPFHRRRIVTTIRDRKMVPVSVTEVAAAVARTLEPRSADRVSGATRKSLHAGFSTGAKLLVGAAGIGASLLVLNALIRARRTSQSSPAS